MRCPRCGNENPAENRFCGMCGATLLAPVPTAPQAVPTPVAPTPIRTEAAAVRSTEPPRTSSPAPVTREDDPPSISGPSFLGLGDAAPRRSVQRTRDSLSIDPNHGRGSGNLDYLLEDDDEPKPSGAWKYLLILVALALAVGFGYLRWKDQGFAWLNLPAKKPAASVEAPDTTSSTPAPVPAPANSAPVSTPPITNGTQSPTGAAGQPSEGSTQPPASGAATPSGAASPPTNPAASGNPAASAPAASAPAARDTSKPPDGASAPTSSDQAAATPPAKDTSANKTDSADNADDAEDAATQPSAKPAAKAPASKPRAAVPVVDPVTEAQKYLYGRGAAQDCDRGLRLLKPAANQGNPKAMIEMGALYSAGLCTPHDLPTAYRWFAMALRKEPDNSSVQGDLQKLWSEMTQPERQLAIKLSQ